MKMSDQLAEKFNRQIDLELASSIAYLQMAAYFDSRSLPDMASWMRIQSDEERAHGLKFFDHVLDRGNKIALGAGEAPKTEFDSAVDAFADGDSASFSMLQWFLEEQIEEESTVSDIVEQLKLVGNDGSEFCEGSVPPRPQAVLGDRRLL